LRIRAPHTTRFRQGKGIIERHNTINNFTEYEVYELDGDEVDEELKHELIEAVKRFFAA